MRKLVLLAFVALLMLMFSGTGQALWYHPDIVMWSEKDIYPVGETVTLYAKNTGNEVILLPSFGSNHIIIFNEDGEKVLWSPVQSFELIPMVPEEVRTWFWDQTYFTWELVPGTNNWVHAPNYGEQVPEGVYTAEQWWYGSVTFRIGYPDYPGASDSHRQDKGHGDICLHWASNEHAKGREHAADS